MRIKAKGKGQGEVASATSQAALNALASAYERAEITVAWAHERASNRHVVLFGAAELCPFDQPSSPIVGEPQHGQLRVAVDKDKTLYVRREHVSVADALAFFRGSITGRTLPGIPSNRVTLESAAPLIDVTMDEEAVLIPSNLGETAGVGAVLPRRATSLGLLSKYDTGSATANWLGAEAMDRTADRVREALDVDLSRFREHLGAIHLCFANPVLRRFEESITSDERSLLVRCYERKGCSVGGCSLELSNEWPSLGVGFNVRHVVTSPFFVIPLPAPPRSFRFRLFDPRGRCIEDTSGVFLREIVTDVGLVSKRKITLVRDDGTEERHEVDTVSYEKSGREAPGVIEPLVHLTNAQRARELDDLARRRDFVLFPGGNESRREARAIVRELVSSARDRCWLVDPYLSSDDAAEVVPFIKSAQCEVRLLSSHRFLSAHDRKGISPELSLANRVSELKQKLRLSLLARKLPGRERSPVHDRMLIVDGAVFMIGSSLSELGSRATTLFRAPHPEKLVAEFNVWWEGALELDPNPRPRGVKEEVAALREHLRSLHRTGSALVALVLRRRPASPSVSE
jgi:hypothetical protein